MALPQLKPINKKEPPKRYLRACGHPNDWTLDLLEMDNKTITSFCMGCIISKLGLQAIAQHKIENNKLVKIWGE